LWAGGITDPPTAIEQVSYLILLRTLDLRRASSLSRSVDRAFREYPGMSWDRVQRLPGEKALGLLRSRLIPFLVEAVESRSFTEGMAGASLALPNARLLRSCIEVVDQLDLGEAGERAAQVYAELLDQLLLEGELSVQMRTSQSLVEAMVELVDPQPHQIICDPAAGAGALLIEVHRRLQESSGPLLGYDLNASMVRLALINMVMHGIRNPLVVCTDTLSRVFEWPTVDAVITHPPFGGSLDRRDVHPGLELDTSRTDVLFLELCRRLLRSRGRAAIVVSEGVLFGRSRAHVEARRRWLIQGEVQAVISLPPRLFDPTSTVRTAILLLAVSGRTEQVLFGQLEAGREQPAGPIAAEPDAELRHLAGAVRWRLGANTQPSPEARALGQRMWTVPVAEIGKQGWALAPSTYRQMEDLPLEDEDPLELLDQVKTLEIAVQQEIDSARAILENRP
jgi:type I restriction enzyme M protein